MHFADTAAGFGLSLSALRLGGGPLIGALEKLGR